MGYAEDLELKQIEIACALYKNLKTLYANFGNNLSSLKKRYNKGFTNIEHYFELIEMALKEDPDKSKMMIDDLIKNFVGIFITIARAFPNEFKLLFKGYKEAKKIDGSYTFHHEVIQYCKETEPKILKAL